MRVWMRIPMSEAMAKSGWARGSVERPVDRQRGDGDDGSGDHRGQGVAGGVEGARVDGLRGPEAERYREDGEVESGGGDVGAVEGASAEEEIDSGEGHGDHESGEQDGKREDARDGGVDGAGEGRAVGFPSGLRRP